MAALNGGVLPFAQKNRVIRYPTQVHLQENELKTKGIQAIGNEETLVSLRGKPKYLIIPESQIEKYEEFRLDKALQEVNAQIEEGNYSTDLDRHLAEIDNV